MAERSQFELSVTFFLSSGTRLWLNWSTRRAKGIERLRARSPFERPLLHSAEYPHVSFIQYRNASTVIVPHDLLYLIADPARFFRMLLQHILGPLRGRL